MTPEQLSQIQQALITLGFFHGEADGEFGPLTRAAIRRYQEAKGLPQNDFLSNEQRQALLEGGTVRSVVDGSNARANSAPSQGTPPQSSPPQQSAPPQSALAKPFAEPPKQYSIVEVANESRACRPAFSDNCITLAKGERVVVLAWQIDDNPRRGLYCLRPMSMIECYYADLTAIEINGVPVPTIGMDKPASVQRVQGPPSAVAPSQETPPQSSPPQQPAPAQRAEDTVLPRQNPSSGIASAQAGGGIAENILTVNDLLRFCSGGPESHELLACEMYLQGAREMVVINGIFGSFHRALRATGESPTSTIHPNVCAPQDAGEKIFFDTAIAALRESQDIGDMTPAALVVGNTWRKRWPCKP